MSITTIQIKSHNVRFLHKKNEEKPILVFIPGNLQEIETIRDFNEGFSENFNYFAIELPGTGHTDPLHPSYNINYLADCLHEFIEQYVGDKFYLVSCSYATALSIEYAKTHSDRLLKLVLAGSMQDIPIDEWPTVLGLMADCLREPAQFAGDFMKLLTAKNVRIPRQRAIIKATKSKASKYTQNQFWCFIFNSIRLMSYRAEHLDRIGCETLCFTGEHDPYVTPSRCKQLAQLIPNSRFTTLPNTDHLFHIEQPQKTVELITDYLYAEEEVEMLTA